MPDQPDSFQPRTGDSYETFVSILAHYEPDLRRFIRSLLPTHADTDEVLQRTAIAIWRKFDQFDLETNFMKWACVVARYEALSYRRSMARDRLVFRDDVFDLLAEEGAAEEEQRKAEETALESCLEELPSKQRQLVTLAYTQGVKVVDLAEEAGASPEAFYMRLSRIRRSLLHCIESKVSRIDPTKATA